MALDNFSYAFPSKGLYCIVGKSGSGKSTIANLAALFDKPSKGKITYKGVDINKWKSKRIDYYHAKEIGMVFQHYNLLADSSVIENVLLPLHALELSTNKYIDKAKELLIKVGIKEELFTHKAKDLSGGEQQRVAICRALINEPNILIADEPTGALDYDNGVNIMNILKDISKDRLVILISHNMNLVNDYKDEIIELKDGKRININTFNKVVPVEIDLKEYKLKRKHKGNDDRWIFKNVFKRLKQNVVKNILIFASLLFSFSFIFVMFGFVIGANKASENLIYEKIDFSACTLSKVERKHINGSALSLDKMSRYSEEEILSMPLIYEYFNVIESFEYYLPINSSLNINGENIENIYSYPIYDFKEQYIDKSLIVKGHLPSNNKKILINEQADEIICKKLNLNTSIGQFISFDIDKEMEILLYNDTNIDIKENFVFDKTFVIAGVCKEFSLVSTPKIYYSAKHIKEELEMNIMNNTSSYFNHEITYYDYLKNVEGDNEVSSYKHNLYLKDIKNVRELKTIIENINRLYDISISSDSLLLGDTFNELLEVSKIGVITFVALGVIGALLILGISSFSSFVFEKKKTSILFAFGISRNQVFSIFLFENILIATLSFICSCLISPLLINVFNYFICINFGISNLLLNVFNLLTNLRVILPILLFLIINIIVYLTTLIPILLAYKINIKEELSAE